MRKKLTGYFFKAVLGVGALLAPGAALAHPHVFVEARAELVFDADKRAVSVRNIWRFDEAFTAFAIQGLDEDGDGALTREELQPLAQVNVDSLKEFDYFTYLETGGEEATFQHPTEYWLDFYDGKLTLFFTLPLQEPVITDASTLALDIYDPTYFVAFEMTREQPFVMIDAPQSCSLKYEPPKALDPQVAAALNQIPASQRDLPEEFSAVTETLSNTAIIKCN